MLTIEQTQHIVRRINDVWRYDVSHYHLGFLQTILRKFRQESCKGCDMMSLEYLLLNDETAMKDFTNRLYIPVSEFFRDPDVFLYIREKLLKYLETHPLVRIWSAGSAHGEEVYSLAILLEEWGIYDRCMLYATDACAETVQKAKQGVFKCNKNMLKSIENYYLSGGRKRISDYFNFDERLGLMRVSDDLKRNICFSTHDLTHDEAFNYFSLVLCRNVFIYFSDEQQDRALDLFYRSLEPLSYLILGQSESIHLESKALKQFETVDSRNRIFRWRKTR